jgi:UDP-glucose 4-epimerase
MRVLVTGGAGYIGSHILCCLRDAGHEAVALDNLYSGHRWAVGDAELVELDLADTGAIRALLESRRFDAVVHCAGHIWVGESVRDPGKYYLNNAARAFGLFELCARAAVPAVIFSSTAAVYGQPETQPIDESTPLRPINPYGASKMMAEWALRDIAAAHGMRFAILRYFNVAGADGRLRVGEATPDNNHLIKVACEAAIGRREGLKINGTDYPTPDGTCIRDYVHVEDLADAHLAAIRHLSDGGKSFIANCGYGHGFSVREVIDAVRRVTGRPIRVEPGPRRPGDPPSLVADATRIGRLLAWRPRHDDLDAIVGTAWSWEQRLARMQGAARQGRPGGDPR